MPPRNHRIYFIILTCPAIKFIMTLVNLFYSIAPYDTSLLQGNINWCNTIINIRSLRGNKMKPLPI